ncbi:NAD(P)-dependent oxidoreductase [bacterium]|nr:NAD(P)-dependent oxidoreductase [bacterium]MBU1652051.1 NAD(P)-dependent oxidoreductase [bacterium]MBU1881835.1 NAD(P)-dependent oxidoreductase [bacterium]
MSETILLTGGNGFVGSHVAEALLEAGYRVRCLLRKHSQLSWIETLPVDVQRADYFDPNALRRVLDGCSAILHFAGATKAPDDVAFMKANAETTRALLDAAASACPDLKLFLFCSSQAALGPSPTLDPLSEEAPPHPLTAYGRSKLEAEKICRQFADKLPISIIRPPAVYGPRDVDILIFFKAIRWGISPSIGTGNRYLSMVYVKDVANITMKLLEKKPQEFGIYHATDGTVHDWDEISRSIAVALKKHPVQLRIPTWGALAISKIASSWASATGRIATLNREKLDDIMQSYWLMSSQKATDELGYQPDYSLDRGVGETAAWYQQMRWI